VWGHGGQDGAWMMAGFMSPTESRALQTLQVIQRRDYTPSAKVGKQVRFFCILWSPAVRETAGATRWW